MKSHGQNSIGKMSMGARSAFKAHITRLICLLLAVGIILGANVLSAYAAEDTDSAADLAYTGAAAGDADEAADLVDTGASSSNFSYMGDADLDGEVSILDATAIQRFLADYFLLPFKSERLSDVDGSGEIDIIDVTFLQRYIADLSCPDLIGQGVANRVMTFSNGYAQPFVVMNEALDDDYTNHGSDIIRFVVYVETDYDSDLDGKRDLVKAWVQLPRAAAEGDYKAPVVFEASPYSTGSNQRSFPFGDEVLEESAFMQSPAKRVPVSVASTEQVSADFTRADIKDYEYFYYNSNVYFLSRGFALVGSAGLGTKGSEGLVCTGSQIEADAYKDIVEWLHGDRTAYTNPTDNIEIKADWTSGKVGMTGMSYLGTLAYEVAATGVDGLETVVPVSAIASWYDYVNSQGASFGDFNYMSWLSGYCSSRFFDLADQSSAYASYLKWRAFVRNAENSHKGCYGEYWAGTDFYASDKIKCSALIVHGLSDNNVRPKQFRLMMDAFERNGSEVKAVLHQSGHSNPGYYASSMQIGWNNNYLRLLNRWMSHYLAGVNNGVENIAKYTVQSNVTGDFVTYDEWESGNTFTLGTGSETGQLTLSRGENKYFGMYIENDTLIKGTVEVHLRAKCSDLSFDKAAVYASLIETSWNTFESYCADNLSQYTASREYLFSSSENRTFGVYKFSAHYPSQVTFTDGMVSLKTPDAGWEPSSAVEPATPVRANEWHDYVIYLNPEVYTVRAGHSLFLWIEPRLQNFNTSESNAYVTFDLDNCYAVIPTA